MKRDALKFDEFNVVSGIGIAFRINISDQDKIVISTDSSTTATIEVLSTKPGKEASLLHNNVFAMNGKLLHQHKIAGGTTVNQQIDLSTPVIGATIDVDLAKAFSAPAEELEKLTQQLYTTLIDTAGCTG